MSQAQSLARDNSRGVMELDCQGPQDGQSWRRRLPTDAPVVLGRDAEEWSVPWEAWMSQRHVELLVEHDQLLVRRLPDAQPVMFRGEEASRFRMVHGDCFVIGQTVFTLKTKLASGSSDTGRVLHSYSMSQEELGRVSFRDAAHRLDVLGHLSKIIFSTMDESELFAQTINLLLEGIRKADVIALVKIDDTQPGRVHLQHVDRRVATDSEFQPSRRLAQEAIVHLKRSLVHVWSSQAGPQDERFTLRGNFDWAFCTPLRGDACTGLGIYVAGQLTGSSPDAILAPGQSNDLSEDVKFAELVATIVSALRQMQALQHRHSVLSHFFSPSVLRVLATTDPERALEPRETQVTVLFCDLRGFSKKVEMASDSLLGVLDRVSKALGVMSTCILDHKGTIADFLGDAAIGFWGWPLARPDDVQHACRAALDIQSAFNAFAQQPDHPLVDFRVGIGLGTGRAVAGQIGSRDQAKVTVFGPVVNLASRLQELTKLLRVPILLDEATADAVTEKMPVSLARCRPLARITPYGLRQPLLVSELLPPADSDPLLTDEHLQHYKRALSAFLDRRWEEAYEQLHFVPPQDRGKDMLLSFILQHNHAPPADWDGVIPMQSKN